METKITFEEYLRKENLSENTITWMIFEIMQSVYIYIPDRLHNIAFLEHIESAL